MSVNPSTRFLEVAEKQFDRFSEAKQRDILHGGKRRVTVTVKFVVTFNRDDGCDKIAASARRFLVDHATDIPMLFQEEVEK